MAAPFTTSAVLAELAEPRRLTLAPGRSLGGRLPRDTLVIAAAGIVLIEVSESGGPDGQPLTSRQRLDEGECYTLPRTGWVSITAAANGAAECALVPPEPRAGRRWAAVAARALTALCYASLPERQRLSPRRVA